MSVIRFAIADAADIRFCVSPLWETVRSRYAVEDAGRHAVHLPWVRAVRGLDCDPVLRAVSRPGAYLPDFLTPPPSGPLATLDEELAVVAATPPDVVLADLRSTARRRPLAVALDDPAGLRDRLCAAVRAWHDAAIAPHWPRMRALLDADIAYRSRQLAEGGLRRLVDTLHPSVRWAGDRIVADDPWDLDLDLRGRGLPLMPSVFVDRRVLWPVRPESPPLAVYPVRAAATLWEAAPATDAALAAVIGTARARLLDLLRAPATTTELARRLGVAAPTVSEHLRLLRDAGLVTSVRHGRAVLYVASARGLSLLGSAH